MTRIDIDTLYSAPPFTNRSTILPKINGVAQSSCVRSTCQVGNHSCNQGTGWPDRLKIEVTFIVTMCGNPSITGRIILRTDGGTEITRKTKTWTSSGTYKISLLYNWSSSPKTEPTYLEELHKLDRRTSSHYIPR